MPGAWTIIIAHALGSGFLQTLVLTEALRLAGGRGRHHFTLPGHFLEKMMMTRSLVHLFFQCFHRIYISIYIPPLH